ncbi:DUF2637 domain-containing protein [Microbispora triticiradicis]|uniref:DUF2637 domain-containing protein n=1 Tax=Microbispora triticiradicis TaxID=2200763 RepID=UPI001AD71019|nr:DUF2637 domain-containing protein [Microbispora triticiradicis]MBO4270304.1 DUF2637 domain-containing protein [Microbispora triticiradicis]
MDDNRVRELLAVIAAVVSYRHMHELALRQGESGLGAALVPLAVALSEIDGNRLCVSLHGEPGHLSRD